MSTFPLEGPVECRDGGAGQAVGVVLDPLNATITHFVLDDSLSSPRVERLVPLSLVATAGKENIQLLCTQAEIAGLEVFSSKTFVANEEQPLEYLESLIAPVDVHYTMLERERIPPGQVAIRRGAQVEATDGHIGALEEFAADIADGRIAHLVLRTGHVWGKKELPLPFNLVERIEDNTVYLQLSQEELASIPAIPVQRRGPGSDDLELMVWTFAGSDHAAEILKALKRVRAEHKIRLANAAVLSKDTEGHATLREIEDLDAQHGALFGAITGALVGLLAGPVGALLGAGAGAATGSAAAHLIDVGFDNQSLIILRDNLQPGTSALVLLVRAEDVAPVKRVLSEHAGEQVRQTITEEMIAQIIAKRTPEPGDAVSSEGNTYQ